MAVDAGDASRQMFFEVHRDLPREGPGNRASTERALRALGPLPERPKILDIGCGPGMQTLDLAELIPDGLITAVDAHAPFLDAAVRRLEKAGCADRVTFQQADMRALPFPEASFDLLWCEGAAYIMGVESALTAWRRLLVPDGRVAFTEAVWLSEARPKELQDWWLAGYPAMDSIDTCLARVRRGGFAVIDRFVLPESAWWDDYYHPMAARIELLRSRFAEDTASLQALAGCQQEVDYFQRWSEHYGYLFVLAACEGAKEER